MMTSLTALWLPILLSAFVCFMGSFVFWAATPWHKPDVKPVPDPAAADSAIGGLNLPAGHYMIPCAKDPAEMKSEAFQERYKRGPWATINVMPAQPNMGKNLIMTYIVMLVISAGIAYLAASVLMPGTATMKVFQVTCTAGVLSYTFGGMVNGIWFAKPSGWVVRDIIDAAVYAVLTGVVFAWLWPAAEAASGGALPLP